MAWLRFAILPALLVTPISALPIHSGQHQPSGQRQHVRRAGAKAFPPRAGLLQGRASKQKSQRSAAWSISQQASKLVKASGRHVFIQFPNSSEVLKLRVKNDMAFDGVMFAGGVLVNGRSSFTARLCTSQCIDNNAAGLFSTVVLGELNWADVEHGRAEVHWASASEVPVPHIETGAYVGPEDPRLDVIQGARFILANINVDEPGCPKFVPEWSNPRRMFFKPLDPIPDAQPCAIQLDEVDRCSVQKNWASLVPRGSSELFFVYSITPFQVLRFDKQRCKASFVRDEDVDTAAPTKDVVPVMQQIAQKPQLKVHGGSRYVFGMAVPEGELYFALGHTAPPEYRQVLVAVLRRLNGHGASFSLAAVSCPIKLSSRQREGHLFRGNTIATSIVDFNVKTDLTLVTYQMNDEKNYITELEGVGKWLQAIHKEFHDDVPVYCNA